MSWNTQGKSDKITGDLLKLTEILIQFHIKTEKKNSIRCNSYVCAINGWKKMSESRQKKWYSELSRKKIHDTNNDYVDANADKKKKRPNSVQNWNVFSKIATTREFDFSQMRERQRSHICKWLCATSITWSAFSMRGKLICFRRLVGFMWTICKFVNTAGYIYVHIYSKNLEFNTKESEVANQTKPNQSICVWCIIMFNATH